jgi:hypothetical protein
VAPKGGGPFVEHGVSKDNGKSVLTTTGEVIIKNAVLMQEKK